MGRRTDVSGRPSLYDFPEVYGTLLAPETDLLDDLDDWVEEYVDSDVASVMDPACGPGNYLTPYAEAGCHVAGNDIRRSMIDEAGRVLSAHSHEVVCGDMVDLRFRTGPFDLALNLAASVGHLATDALVIKHLRSVALHLRPGGVYLMGVVVLPPDSVDEDLWSLWESEPTPMPSGGMAAVRYESLRRDGKRRRERIRVVVLANGVPDCPQAFQETYTLHTFNAGSLERVLGAADDFELLAAHDMIDEERASKPIGEGSGDVTLVLRRT